MERRIVRVVIAETISSHVHKASVTSCSDLINYALKYERCLNFCKLLWLHQNSTSIFIANCPCNCSSLAVLIGQPSFKVLADGPIVLQNIISQVQEFRVFRR